MTRSVHSFHTRISSVSAIYDSTDEKLGHLKPLTKSQKCMIVVIVLGVLLASSIYSCLASFFPQSAFEKGLDSAGVGAIIGVFPLATIIFGGAAGYLISKIGSRFVFVASLFMVSGATIPFAFVMLAERGFPFYFSCISCRVFQGLGFLGCELSALSICVGNFKERLSTFVGLIEMSIGAGISVGPAIGGIIYDAFGFYFPFYMFGAIGMLLAIAAYIFVHPAQETPKDFNDGSDQQEISLTKFLLIPSIYIPMMTSLLMSMNMSYFDVSISPYITDLFDKSVSEAGLIIFGYAGIYALMCPVIGSLTDKKGHHSEILVIGCLLVAPSFLFVGPATFLNIKPQLWITVTFFLVIGFGSSFMYVPTVELSFQICRDKGYKDSIKLRSIITTVILFWSNMGNLVGPFLGGILVEYVGFPNTGALFSLFTLLMGLSSVIYIIFKKIRNQRKPSNEKKYLLAGHIKR